jgi:hypothetical protein
MPRPVFIAVFALLLASVPLSAQHGGGHASGGGHGGMASHGSFSGGHSSGQAFSGTHSNAGFGAHSFSGPGSRSFSSRAFNHSGGVRISTYGFRNNCYGYSCRYGNPWGYAGFYNPYWWSNSGSSFDYDQQYQTGLANQMNAQSLDEQRMRQQQDQDAYAQSALPPPRERSEHAELNEAAPATVLVFRDEHKQEVHNYAIVGQTLWNFNPQHTQKIPLSDLDIPATTKENDEHGVDFHVPVAGDGQ